ncbi:hypothetical protein [Winogradskyella helgolandensis]|uniref:hypothetical protein n=1 Tax=Winogradskyella helgolandensis TaxID=2697010 RepID=UPI0015C99D0D|nr:hypothetical protein [Winogradskyella helgolandensis]
MTIERAMNIIQNMIEQKGLPEDDFRITAYNILADYIIKKEIKQLDRQQLSFKLYILSVMNFVNIYKTSIYDQIAIRELHKYLNMPIDYHINTFCSDLNNKEQSELFNNLNLSKSYPCLITKDVNNIEVSKLIESIKDDQNRNILFGQYWSCIEVEFNLRSQFSNFLNDYNSS